MKINHRVQQNVTICSLRPGAVFTYWSNVHVRGRTNPDNQSAQCMRLCDGIVLHIRCSEMVLPHPNAELFLEGGKE